MKQINLTNLEDCFLIVSEKDYSVLKKFKWRYTRGGVLLTNIKKYNGKWTTCTINKILNPDLWRCNFLFNDGNILNVSKSNRLIKSCIKNEEKRENLIDLRDQSIDYLDSIFLNRLKEKKEYKYRGVTLLNNCYEGRFKDNKNRYLVTIGYEGITHYFGIYFDMDTAGRIYNENAIKFFGNKAILNIIGKPGELIKYSKYDKVIL